MKETLKGKIDYFESVLLTRIQNQTGLNFTEQSNRDARTAINNIGYFKSWLNDYNKLKGAVDQNCEKIAISYLLDNESSFSLALTNYITNRLTEVEPAKAFEVINEVAWLIAYEKVKGSFISHIIESCPNSSN